MTEPFQPPSTPESPFAPRPPRSLAGPGCSKPLMVGCGILLVLLGISAVVIAWNAAKVLEWAFQTMGSQVLASLPEDIPPEDRARLEQAFEAMAVAAAEGRVDPARMQAFNSAVQAFAAKPREEITRQDVQDLALQIEEAAGREPAATDSSPVREAVP